jgi:hypothetical protein
MQRSETFDVRRGAQIIDPVGGVALSIEITGTKSSSKIGRA